MSEFEEDFKSTPAHMRPELYRAATDGLTEILGQQQDYEEDLKYELPQISVPSRSSSVE
jgi:hypothetical protein